MKKKVFGTVAITFIVSFLIFSTVNASTTNIVAEKKATHTAEHSIGYNLGRGLANIGLCWLEIPRQIVHQGSMVPIFGLVSGTIYGGAVTIWRALSGVTDILSLGFGGGNIYFAQGLPEFPWQGYWVRHKKVK